MDFRIHKLLYSEVKSVYPDLFERIFKERGNGHIPSYVYIAFLGEDFAGMVSAYLHNADSIYMSFGSFDDNIKKYNRPLLFGKVVEHIHKEFRNIAFKVENTNTPMIKIAMNCGFIPTSMENDMLYKDGMFTGKIYLVMRERG